ncbi:hypothetical protein QNI19_28970 [Cytophagaceae bacterium DM2B3-1]|uniref:Uncharacterized protein n=1 Tax=Xanthocytophaga flava TaxID=3048013 RepID=A0ABT7CWL4_9BACT|nr:hypothetical protein [Xanthocytophaga flavus]MDJ1472220.1 hypothetical protein [Xanthocytophaga flavus]MDJ1497004.1 hypothetical protein [Xanthocytophaga flavus]
MKAHLKTEFYYRFDGHPKSMSHIQNALHEMGYPIYHIEKQESDLQEETRFHLFFDKPVPEIIMASVFVDLSFFFSIYQN